MLSPGKYVGTFQAYDAVQRRPAGSLAALPEARRAKYPTLHEELMDVAKLRKSLNMSQEEFWGRIGITQSGGSRYESGRRVPEPVRLLLVLAYGRAKDRDAALRHLRAGLKTETSPPIRPAHGAASNAAGAGLGGSTGAALPHLRTQ